MRVKRSPRRQRAQRKRRFWRGLEAVCIAALLILLTMIAVRTARQRQRESEEQSAGESLARMTAETAAPEASPSASAAPQMLAEAEALLAENADLVGMVGFGDVTLYVCQSDDNAYYAEHRFDGSEDPAGMIYMDCRCSAWPLGVNTILYGHNMQDGSRFGKLRRLTQADYLEQYPTVRYASLYEVHDYQPIAVFYASTDPASEDYFDFAQTTFADNAAYEAYVQAARARSVVALDADAEPGDPLLTLVTCSEEGTVGRLIVLCRQIEE